MEELVLKSYKRSKVHPQKFALWISMASMVMMFASLSSAYIVRQAAGNWFEFNLPNLFYVSTVIILLSSVALHKSYKSFIAQKEKPYKRYLVLAFILGIGFVVSQYLGWQQLYALGIDLKGNPSGSFLYVITFIHVLHVVGGIACLIVAMLHAFTLKFNVTEKRKHRFELVNQYWHFVDVLWIYLLVFLLICK